MLEEPNPYNKRPIFEFSINLTKVKDWWIKRKRKKRMTEAELYEWIYEDCGCKVGMGYRSSPYCAIHHNKLRRRLVKEKG